MEGTLLAVMGSHPTSNLPGLIVLPPNSPLLLFC